MMINWNTPTLMQFGPVQDCGCPWEQWILFGITLDMHFEPCGRVDVYADGGDWDRSLQLDSREAAFKWVEQLPTEEQLEQLRAEMCDV